MAYFVRQRCAVASFAQCWRVSIGRGQRRANDTYADKV